jgi:hypothetical protein
VNDALTKSSMEDCTIKESDDDDDTGRSDLLSSSSSNDAAVHECAGCGWCNLWY